MLSIETEEIAKGVAPNINKKEEIIMPLNEADFWDSEVFHINLILINGDAINASYNRIKISMSCEDNFTNSHDLELKEYSECEKLKLRFVYFNSTVRPLITLTVKLPDTRLKNQANNLLKMMAREMVRNLKIN